VPRIWSETIAAHRDAVRDATLDATAALVAEHGLTGVTMSQIAKESGIGRATLYKYFPDIESILAAWHERHIGGHLHHLAQVAGAAAGRARASGLRPSCANTPPSPASIATTAFWPPSCIRASTWSARTRT
jgi:AcrR family transcriptional regulator